MINQYAGVSTEYSAGKFEPVPEGSYVGRIDAVRVEGTEYGQVLVVAVDIAEGPLAGYYRKRFTAESKTDPSAKYKGTYRLTIPTGDGSERDGWNVNKFNRMLGAVKASNVGFNWDWNEQALIGKSVGLVYRTKEWAFNGNTGFTTEIGMLCSTDDARKGNIKLKPRLLANKPTASPAAGAAGAAGFTATTEELPF